VLWGAGGTFCAGADLKGVATARGNRLHEPTGAALDGAAPMGPTRMMLSKPVIAAVAGYAVAGGIELACWCDLRVAEEDAVFGVYCRRWGVPLIDGGTVRLPRLIGQSRALDMILTGRSVPAPEAFAMGLANRVVPKGTSRAEAETLAAELARLPQTCLRSDRLSVYEQFDSDFAAALANEFAHGTRTLASGEAQAGAARFASGKGRGGSFDDI
jgi:enoyl-CoA hydratase